MPAYKIPLTLHYYCLKTSTLPPTLPYTTTAIAIAIAAADAADAAAATNQPIATTKSNIVCIFVYKKHSSYLFGYAS